jgi:hypothetical protein
MAYGIAHSLWRFVRFSTPNTQQGEFKNAINNFLACFLAFLCMRALKTPQEPQRPHTKNKKGRVARSVRRASLLYMYIVGRISRKTSDSTDKSNGQNPLDIAVTNALELLRGQNFEN